MARFLTDEHIPGPFISALRSLGFDVVRARDEHEAGIDDRRLLDSARRSGRVVLTCDRRFTVVDGSVTTGHAGVIYADQTMLQARPEDAASGVDRIVTAIPPDELAGMELYLRAWM